MPKDTLYPISFRFRLSADLKARLVAEAARRGVRASDLARELIAEGCPAKPPIVKTGGRTSARKHAL